MRILTDPVKNYSKSLPQLNSLTQPFWDYCKKHELRMQFCTRCSEWIWYPKAWCPRCGRREEIEWKRLTGYGTIYSFTVIRQVIENSLAFQSEIPFAIGLIETEEGPRMYSNIIANVQEVAIGKKVSVFFEDVTENISLPKFKLC
jgi:uncharacterized OB-fold protein